MRLLLIGAPGAGKGTQAGLLAERFNITHISSGDLLRQHVRDQTSIGQTIKAYVDVQGAVHLDVPDEELIRRLLARGRGSDDTEEVIAHRLQVYREKTIPLLEYYAGREWMFAVDGAQPADQVHADIVGRLRKLAAFDTSTGL